MVKHVTKSNRTIYYSDDFIVLRSYNAYVACIDRRDGTLSLGALWDYSPTTWRHIRKLIVGCLDLFSENTYGWMYKMLHSKNGRAYMQTLVDTGIIHTTSTLQMLARASD